jgi:predicted metal-dependent phosphoesterase TrpH
VIDLHLHSINSDGLDTPSQLIDKALEINLKAIALTDHDTISGLKEFLSYGEDKDIILIPGIEFSIRNEPEREIKDTHVIGLNIDENSTKLRKSLQDQLKGRLEQKEAICIRLKKEFGYDISFEEVKSVAKKKVVGRPHIVEIMKRNNPALTQGVSNDDLFKMISVGGEAFVERTIELTLEDSIDLIKSVGGIPILAHPGIYNVSNRVKFIEFCIRLGLEGIEVEYPYAKNRPFHNTDRAKWAQEILPNYFRKIAERYALKKSGGSDYHGEKKGINIGDIKVPDKYLKSFL